MFRTTLWNYEYFCSNLLGLLAWGTVQCNSSNAKNINTEKLWYTPCAPRVIIVQDPIVRVVKSRRPLPRGTKMTKSRRLIHTTHTAQKKTKIIQIISFLDQIPIGRYYFSGITHIIMNFRQQSVNVLDSLRIYFRRGSLWTQQLAFWFLKRERYLC